MAERRDNSVLFSLSELRQIEEERVQQEVAGEQARVAAEIKAKEDVERRAREDVERRAREEEDRRTAEVRRREQEERDATLRLQESERRARIEAETKLRSEQMRLEVEAKARAKKLPIPQIVAGVVVLLGIVIGVSYKFYSDAQAEKATIAAENARIAKENQEKQAQIDASMKKLSDLQAQLARASSAEEKAKLLAAIGSEKDAVTRLRSRPTRAKSAKGGSDSDSGSAKPAKPADEKKKVKISDSVLPDL